MDWADAKPWIAKVAPMLGAALGGPLGGTAGALVANALGVKDASPDSIVAAVKSGTLSAENIVALKLAEQEFQLKAEKMGIDSVQALEELAFKDRDSARQREIKTGDSWTPRILAGFVVLSWVAINGFLVSHSMVKPGQSTALDNNMEPMLMRVLGTLDAALSFVLAYYFGSSVGESRKSELLHQSTPTNGPM